MPIFHTWWFDCLIATGVAVLYYVDGIRSLRSGRIVRKQFWYMTMIVAVMEATLALHLYLILTGAIK